MKLGFIGFGEAALNIIIGLLSEKKTNIIVYDSDSSKAKVQLLNMKDAEYITIANDVCELTKCTDVIFVAVPARVDMEVFETFIDGSINGKLFVDLCTALPNVKRNISKLVDKSGNKYVDAAVMGSIPRLKHRTPLLVSGSGSVDFINDFKEYSMNIKLVADEAGRSSIIKLCRSIYMKGIAALSIEVAEVSKAYGVYDEVMQSLAQSMDADNFMTYTSRLVDGTIKHCKRRKSEVEDCLEIIQSKNLEGNMTKATRDVYNKILKNME